MARILRWLGLSVVCLGVAASAAVLAAVTDAEAETPSEAAMVRGHGHARRVTRTAVKPKTAKKKVRGKRGASKAAMPDEEAEKAPAGDAPAAVGDGELKFSRDIAPIIVGNCAGCHNPPRQKRVKLDMSTFEKLMAGAPSGPVVVAGKPEESHLVLRIKGEETPRMPQGNQRTLSAAAIDKIERWVKAGALLDKGMDPKKPIESYAASPDDLRKGELAKMTNDQRDKQVEAVGRERWKKASAKTTPEVTNGTHFLLFSTLPKDRAAHLLKAIDGQYAKVRALLGPASVEWGEKASLFVLNDAGSYAAFVQANENREAETGDTGTAKLSSPQPYVAVVDPLGGREEPAGSAAPKKPARSKRGGGDEEASPGGSERTLAGVLTEQLVIGSAARAGKPPRWLSLGLGAMMASRVEPRSPYYKKIRRDAYGLYELGWQTKAQEALGDATKSEEIRAVGFSNLEWAYSVDKRVLPEFIKGMLAGGEKLDDVLEKSLGMSREQFLEQVSLFVAAKYAR